MSTLDYFKTYHKRTYDNDESFKLLNWQLTTSSNPDGQLHSLLGGGGAADDATLATLLPRILDMEDADKETTHLLVFLLMQFLSRSDQASPTDEKYIKAQSIVLKHLYLLLGFNHTERTFHIPPYRLRYEYRSYDFNL